MDRSVDAWSSMKETGGSKERGARVENGMMTTQNLECCHKKYIRTVFASFDALPLCTPHLKRLPTFFSVFSGLQCFWRYEARAANRRPDFADPHFCRLTSQLGGKECKKFNCVVNYERVQLFGLLAGNSSDNKWDIATYILPWRHTFVMKHFLREPKKIRK